MHHVERESAVREAAEAHAAAKRELKTATVLDRWRSLRDKALEAERRVGWLDSEMASQRSEEDPAIGPFEAPRRIVTAEEGHRDQGPTSQSIQPAKRGR
jgi:hypothetical protein